jgi:hypothetical protein
MIAKCRLYRATELVYRSVAMQSDHELTGFLPAAGDCHDDFHVTPVVAARRCRHHFCRDFQLRSRIACGSPKTIAPTLRGLSDVSRPGYAEPWSPGSFTLFGY